MNSTAALPPKAAKNVCRECGMEAHAPIVVANRCSNRKACDLRLLRKLNKAKEAKS
jgi:hypothetical protein